jgi:TolB-like protein/Flp pilus assembly protein TadD
LADSLFTELKRRNVFKVGTAYLVLAWVVIQVTSEAVPAMHLPDWVNSLVFLLGVIGFPFALFFAWAFEITPEGVKKETDIAVEDSITAHTGRKLDFVIIGLLAVGMSYFFYESRLDTDLEETAITVNDSATVTPVESLKEVIQEPEGSSIAVLPFVNMSSDKEQEYFSDGISEEILNVLAKIPNLHVTSRSSAFAFKGKEINIKEVATTLGVNNILEGSVRKFGNRIRITAQLIEAGTDKHLWSETYDRELLDLFTIQDEISAAIVKALKEKLGLNAKIAQRDMSDVNLDAHNEYLKGRFFIENRNQADIKIALQHFTKASEIAPDYAPAWVGIAWANAFLSEFQYGSIPEEVARIKAMPAIEKALLLDPTLPEAQAIRGMIFNNSVEEKKQANHYLEKALELNPNFADAMIWLATNIEEDEPAKAISLRNKAVQLNPMSLLANFYYGNSLVALGKFQKAHKVAQHMQNINPKHHFAYMVLGEIYLQQGQYAQAIYYLDKAAELIPTRVNNKFMVSNRLVTIGLGEMAASYFIDTPFEVFQYWFKNNMELYTSQTRDVYPRAEDDSLGIIWRAITESRAENYPEAVKYYQLDQFCSTCSIAIYSYLQVGDMETAKRKLDLKKQRFAAATKAGIKYWRSYDGFMPIEIEEMDIAYLDGDIDKTIRAMQSAMEKGYIVDYDFQKIPMYEALRTHPQWPEIMAESNQRATEQRTLYLKLAEEENASSL